MVPSFALCSDYSDGLLLFFDNMIGKLTTKARFFLLPVGCVDGAESILSEKDAVPVDGGEVVVRFVVFSMPLLKPIRVCSSIPPTWNLRCLKPLNNLIFDRPKLKSPAAGGT